MLIILVVGFEVTQPLPEPALLMRTMPGAGALARTCAAADAGDVGGFAVLQLALAMLGSPNPERTSTADAHNARGRFRGHPAIARTSTVDAHYARRRCPGENLCSS